MAKKSFLKSTRQNTGAGINSIVKNTTQIVPQEVETTSIPAEPAKAPQAKAQVIPPQTIEEKVEVGPSSEKGCKPGDTRKTFILRKDLVEKMMDIAYWEPGKMKDHVNAAFSAYVEEHWKEARPEGS